MWVSVTDVCILLHTHICTERWRGRSYKGSNWKEDGSTVLSQVHSPFLRQSSSPSGTQPAPTSLFFPHWTPFPIISTSFPQSFKINPCACALGWAVSLAMDRHSCPCPHGADTPVGGNWTEAEAFSLQYIYFKAVKVPGKQRHLDLVWRLKELRQSRFRGYFQPKSQYRWFQRGPKTHTRHSDRKAVLCQGRRSLARPAFFLPSVNASYRELPSLLPPLTSQLPLSEPCRGCDVPLVPVRSLTASQVPICHMNQSWKFIWSLGGLSPSLHDLSETWSKSTLLSGRVLPVYEMRLLCSKEICLNFFFSKSCYIYVYTRAQTPICTWSKWFVSDPVPSPRLSPCVSP